MRLVWHGPVSAGPRHGAGLMLCVQRLELDPVPRALQEARGGLEGAL